MIGQCILFIFIDKSSKLIFFKNFMTQQGYFFIQNIFLRRQGKVLILKSVFCHYRKRQTDISDFLMTLRKYFIVKKEINFDNATFPLTQQMICFNF